MWTPKRILLLSVGFLGFTLVYLVYSMTTLGRINTLPPLPERYRSDSDNIVEVRPPEATPSPLVLKLERAFGKECKEKKWPVQLELNSKSIVMAAENYKFETDGKMLLESMSIALFGKKKNNSQEVEINTLRCRRAYITFDQPVTSLATKELSGRKIVEAKLHGEGNTPIVIENNRRTSRLDDDLRVTINHGPLYYHEAKHLIWTNDLVEVQDGCPLPKAHIVAKGMVMELATAAPPPKPGAPLANKPKSENISGVKRIVLKQDVTMHLFVSGSTPFPGGAKDRPTPPAENKNAAPASRGADATPLAKPPEPAHIIIRTPGRFQYNLFKDHDLARFDVPDDADQTGSPQDVTVERIVEEGAGSDQLVCKHLELRLKRHSGEAKPGKTASAETPAQSPEQELEIEWAHATGPNVTLTSDAEKLDAHGNDFFHDAAKKLTILKGAPFMEANKEDSLIQAPELRIQEVPLPLSPKGSKEEEGQPKTYQQIHASGPGEVHMLNKTTNKQTTHAYWNKELISTRDGELDLLILTGEARFVEDGADEEHKQWLKADTLKVWLLAEDKKPDATAKKPETKDATAKKPAAPEQSRRPHHIEALRNIVSHSPQLNIPAAGRLLVRFTDVPAERIKPFKRTPASAAKTGAKPQQPPAVGAASRATSTGPATPTQASGGRQPPVAAAHRGL
ncbi:MAG TPA: hypothetical protein VH575_13070, partial [Gemmataceae bacterium]